MKFIFLKILLLIEHFLNLPIHANTHENEARKIKTKHSKESHYATHGISSFPWNCSSPPNFQWHHEESHLQKYILALIPPHFNKITSAKINLNYKIWTVNIYQLQLLNKKGKYGFYIKNIRLEHQNSTINLTIHNVIIFF